MRESEILGTAAAAQYVGLAATTFCKLRLGGGGPKYMKLGKTVRYDTADLDKWLESKKVSSTSEYACYAGPGRPRRLGGAV